MDHVQESFVPDKNSVEPLEVRRNKIIDTRQRRTTNEKLETMPSDREIPRFLQEDLEEVLGISHSDKPSKFNSRGVQTRIGGVRTFTNFLYSNDFAHPVTVMSSSATPRDPSSCISYSSELSLTRSHLYNVHCNYEKLKLRFHKLHEDYYKLLRVTGELTVALENSARGNSVDLPSTLKSCIDAYPDLFNRNVRHESTEIMPIKSEIELGHYDLTESKQPILGIIPVSSKQLDFKKIKLHLINGNVKTKLLLLQALRWKITLSQPAERDEAIHDYTSSDILGLHGQIANDSGKSILPYLFIPLDVVLPHPLQQSAARLLNTLASLRCGRDYLSVGPSVLNVVIQCLDTARAETIDSFTCDMILATLQKMSLRKQQRLYMIGMGLVEWLIYHLKAENKKMGTYRLEYTTALLMNLSLHREAQVRASTMTSLVLSTLTELLSSSHLPALPYVNGILNNFLANRTINEEAKKFNLDDVLEYHRKRHSGEIRRHLDYILNRLRRHSNESIDDNIVMADNDTEQLDVLENELDDLDPVKVHAGELFGEALLATCYSVPINTTRVLGQYDNSEISSATVSKDDSSESNNQTVEIADNGSNEPSPQEKIISPSINAPRMTPPSRKLTGKNTTSLKMIVLPEKFPELAITMDQSVDTIDDFELSSGSEIDDDRKDSLSCQSSSADSVDFRTDANFKESNADPVESAMTWISAYESGTELDDRMSSIASFTASKDSAINEEKGRPEIKRDQERINAEDDAFVSKPRIMRTPPNSASIAVSLIRNENRPNEVIPEK